MRHTIYIRSVYIYLFLKKKGGALAPVAPPVPTPLDYKQDSVTEFPSTDVAL